MHSSRRPKKVISTMMKRMRSRLLRQRLANLKLPPHSLHILNKIEAIHPSSYLFGGGVRDACLARLFQKKQSRKSDTDILTTASESDILKACPYLTASLSVEKLYTFRGMEYNEDIDIKQIDSLDTKNKIKNLENYVDCTINSLLFNSTEGLIDPTGEALADLEDGIIRVYKPKKQDSLIPLLRALLLELKYQFQLSKKTQRGMFQQFSSRINTKENAKKVNKIMIKIFTEGDTRTTLARLMGNLSETIKVKVIDLFFPPIISHAIKKAYASPQRYQQMIEVIEKQKIAGAEKNIGAVYHFFIMLMINDKDLLYSTVREEYDAIVNKYPIFTAALAETPRLSFDRQQ